VSSRTASAAAHRAIAAQRRPSIFKRLASTAVPATPVSADGLLASSPTRAASRPVRACDRDGSKHRPARESERARLISSPSWDRSTETIPVAMTTAPGYQAIWGLCAAAVLVSLIPVRALSRG
jgi:hypothetical protein